MTPFSAQRKTKNSEKTILNRSFFSTTINLFLEWYSFRKMFPCHPGLLLFLEQRPNHKVPTEIWRWDMVKACASFSLMSDLFIFSFFLPPRVFILLFPLAFPSSVPEPHHLDAAQSRWRHGWPLALRLLVRLGQGNISKPLTAVSWNLPSGGHLTGSRRWVRTYRAMQMPFSKWVIHLPYWIRASRCHNITVETMRSSFSNMALKWWYQSFSFPIPFFFFLSFSLFLSIPSFLPSCNSSNHFILTCSKNCPWRY